jgi:putative nucleotidyltransferase with HDIG domain
MATLYKQVNEAPQLSGPGAESIPPLLVPILRRALAKDAAGRYANVREMADALSSAQTELFPPRALTPAPVRARAADTTRRSVAAQAAASPLLLETIEELSASLGDHPGLEQLVDTVAHCGKKLTGAHSARVLLLSGSAGREWIVESSGGDGGHELRGMAFAPGEGLAPLVIESGAPLRLPRATDHPRYRPPCDALPSAAGFLCVPVIHGETLGVLEVAGRDGGFGSDDEDVLLRFARHAALSLDSVAAGERAMDSFTHTADLLVSFLERLDILYANHSRNVAAFADMIAPRLGLNEDEQLRLHFAALLHDVGKIRVDPAVLRAPAPLTPEQRRQMQEHVTLGVQLLTPLAPWADVTRIIAAHHERWDGKGYPNRLSREAIPLGSRILSVADVFDSITSAGTGATQALTAMRALGGSQFDPQVVEAFVSEQRDRQVRLAPR